MNLVVLSDFDGTITRIDTAEFVLARFAQGDWQVFNAQFESGKITLEECLRRQFSLVRSSKKRILDELADVVTLRPNFGELAEYCRKNLVPTTIVSAGLDFVIEHFLELNNWQKLVEIYMAKTKLSTKGIEFTFPMLFDKTSANFKQDLVRRCKNESKKVLFVGDGSGDYAAAEEADYLFAIEDSRLAGLCEDHEIHYKAITDFAQVIDAIRELKK
ncbi:MtnX-like HAD-IB family phosphatase [Candidatus Bathyarchaeota archaeon]|nr:MtnX-like HAD-IB family phosphatase [Candidatus Bathyarchaeota archaeon]